MERAVMSEFEEDKFHVKVLLRVNLLDQHQSFSPHLLRNANLQ